MRHTIPIYQVGNNYGCCTLCGREEKAECVLPPWSESLLVCIPHPQVDNQLPMVICSKTSSMLDGSVQVLSETVIHINIGLDIYRKQCVLVCVSV